MFGYLKLLDTGDTNGVPCIHTIMADAITPITPFIDDLKSNSYRLAWSSIGIRTPSENGAAGWRAFSTKPSLHLIGPINAIWFAVASFAESPHIPFEFIHVNKLTAWYTIPVPSVYTSFQFGNYISTTSIVTDSTATSYSMQTRFTFSGSVDGGVIEATDVYLSGDGIVQKAIHNVAYAFIVM